MQKIKSRKIISIGNVKIGTGEPIAIQTMLNIKPTDIECNVKLAQKLKEMGCDILRVAVPDLNSARLLTKIKGSVDVAIVADIHFDYKLALASIDAGADKIRINPGNIGSKEQVKEIVKACRVKNIPIRVGINAGSLEKDILKKYKKINAAALCESAIKNIRILESFDFDNIVVSIKSSNVVTTVRSYEMLAKNCNYPLHIGITEAGSGNLAIVKSSIGIGSLLLNKIGDTIRVSLTGSPEAEIICAKDILKSLGLIKNYGIEIISCPTCGRTNVNLINIVKKVKENLSDYNKNIKIAIMGCCVNGPGEAKCADIGIAAGIGCGILFKHGKILKKVPEEKLVETLVNEVKKMQ